MRKNHIYLTTLLFIISLFFSSCASMKGYFNTFYNAEQYFIKAEKIRMEAQGDKIPNSALDNYQKVIEKSQIVLNNNLEFNKLTSFNFVVIKRITLRCSFSSF